MRVVVFLLDFARSEPEKASGRYPLKRDHIGGREMTRRYTQQPQRGWGWVNRYGVAGS